MAIHRKILRWLENELFEGNIQLGQDLPSDSEIARAIGVGENAGSKLEKAKKLGIEIIEEKDLNDFLK